MGLVAVFFNAFLIVLNVIEWLVIIWVIISWLLFFASQTSFRWRNKGAYTILNQLNDIFGRMAWPFLRPFRRILPPHKTAVVSAAGDTQRDGHIQTIAQLGRMAWQKLTGYHLRNYAENGCGSARLWGRACVVG